MNNKIIPFLFLSIYSSLTIAQKKNTPVGKSSTVQVSTDKALQAKLDSLFSSYDENTPGIAITILENGKVIAKKAYGMASLEYNIPFSHQSVKQLYYSEGREFISIAAALMDQKGIIKLEDKVRSYFPKLPLWAEPVTIWDLLNHSSGFIDEWSAFSLVQQSFLNQVEVSEFLNLLYRQPTPEIEPGKGYLYSNSDFGLLRLILEKATGQNLSKWMKENVFTPLEMHATFMRDEPYPVVKNLATSYYTPVVKTSPGANYFVYTSAQDLEKWLLAHSTDSSPIAKAAQRVLSGSRELHGLSNHYAIGYAVETLQGHQVITHQGNAKQSYLIRVPSKNLAIICVGNDYRNTRSVLNYLLKVSPPPKPVFVSSKINLPTEAYKKYTGRWKHVGMENWRSNVDMEVFSEFNLADSVLQFRYDKEQEPVSLIPVGNNLFYCEQHGEKVQTKFYDDASGVPMKVEIFASNGFRLSMIREHRLPWNPSKEELKKFTGRYYSKHLDYYWTIITDDDGRLIIKRPTIADTAIDPHELNQFLIPISRSPGSSFPAYLLFHKNDKGDITHFTVWHTRLMHHQFDKIE